MTPKGMSFLKCLIVEGRGAFQRRQPEGLTSMGRLMKRLVGLGWVVLSISSLSFARQEVQGSRGAVSEVVCV